MESERVMPRLKISPPTIAARYLPRRWKDLMSCAGSRLGALWLLRPHVNCTNAIGRQHCCSLWSHRCPTLGRKPSSEKYSIKVCPSSWQTSVRASWPEDLVRIWQSQGTCVQLRPAMDQATLLRRPFGDRAFSAGQHAMGVCRRSIPPGNRTVCSSAVSRQGRSREEQRVSGGQPGTVGEDRRRRSHHTRSVFGQAIWILLERTDDSTMG